MQKSAIEWTEFVSNPVKGKCLHGCYYCYAEQIRLRFKQPAEPTYYSEELTAIEARRKPAVIFMGSMHDIFGKWVPNEIINSIITTADLCHQHTFLFLTKNPDRYFQFDFPRNCCLGATATDQPSYDTAHAVLSNMPRKNKVFISMEPLISHINPILLNWIDGIIIGAMTGANAVQPKREWIDYVMYQAKDMPVFVKDNLISIYPDLPKRRETAWKL